MKRRIKQFGFTLVELSIVLVILGLLVGGVLAGQSLIRAAEMRSITTDWNQHILAFNAFRDKYFVLPGDMPNATSFWTAADPVNGTCLTTVRSGASTCNGDGNNNIDDWNLHEQNLMWEHLSLANLVSGNYVGFDAGINMGTGPGAILGVTIPRSRIARAGWAIAQRVGMNASAGGVLVWPGRYNHQMLLGNFAGMTTYPAYIGNHPILSPNDSFLVDAKADDGKPGTGRIRAVVLPAACTSAAGVSSAYATATYSGSNTDLTCGLMFDMGI